MKLADTCGGARGRVAGCLSAQIKAQPFSLPDRNVFSRRVEFFKQQQMVNPIHSFIKEALFTYTVVKTNQKKPQKRKENDVSKIISYFIILNPDTRGPLHAINLFSTLLGRGGGGGGASSCIKWKKIL